MSARTGGSRILEVFGVEPDEVSALAGMGALAVLGALVRAYLFSITNALYLTEFAADQLGGVYILGAVLVGGGGSIYRVVAARVSLAGLMLGMVALMALGLIVLRLALDTGGASVAVFVLPAWFQVVWVYGWIVLWGLAKHIFDIRQAKRLFGLIGAGEALGELLGGLSVAPVVETVGTIDAIWIVVGICALQMLLLRTMLARFASARVAAGRALPPGRRDARSRRRYVALVIALSACLIVGFWFMDLLFMTQVEWLFERPEDAAAFLGRLFSLVAGVTLVTRSLMSGRLLSRFGLRLGLLFMPASTLCVTLAIWVFGSLSGQTSVVAALAVGVFVIWRVARDTLDKPSTLLLYQVLPSDERLRVHVLVETIWDSLATVAAGVFLVLLSRTERFGPHLIGAWMSGLLIVWLVVALRILARYPDMLRDALSRRRFGGAPLGAGGSGMSSSTAGMSGVGSVRPYLLQDLRDPDRMVRIAAARALAGDEGGVVDPREVVVVEAAIEDTRRRADRHVAVMATAIELGADAVTSAYELELRHVRRQLGQLLSLLYEPAVRDGLSWLDAGEHTLSPMALELLETVLSRRHRSVALPVLARTLVAESVRAPGHEHAPAPVETLAGQLSREPGELSDWTRASIVRWLAQARPDSVITQLQHRASLVREAALGGLARAGHPDIAALAQSLCDDPAPEVRLLVAWLSNSSGAESSSMLTTTDRVQLLSDLDFFAECGDDVLADVARTMSDERFDPGVEIITQGSEGTTMYVIVEGTVGIQIDGRPIREHGPTEVFGELAALAPAPRTATCIAQTQVRVLSLDHRTLLDLIQDQPAFGAGLIRFLCQRVRSLTPVLIDGYEDVP